MSCVQVAEFGRLLVWARASGAYSVTIGAVPLDKRSARLNALLRLREPRRRNSQSHKTIPGADQSRIEQKRGLEIGDRLFLAPLRLVDISAVIVGQRVIGLMVIAAV